MIKMGIYGIFRILTFITPYQSWWGILLIGMGAVSGILGVLFAIGQHDIKKLLAYHSVENIGIIMMGMGIGLTGVVYNLPGIAFFGFAGASLALIGGLAAACFTKLIGVAILGEQRTILPSPVTEVPKTMILGMIIPAFVSIAIGMGSYWIVPVLIKPVSIMTGTLDLKNVELMMNTTKIITILQFSILGIGLLIALLYRAIIRKNIITQNVETWGCGYTAPDVSMEYTSSSFAQPVTEYFSIPLDMSKNENISTDFFPDNKWSFHSEANDWILTKIIEPFIVWVNRIFTSFKWFQNGRSGLYVLYIAITILLLITWKFFL